MYVSGTKEKLLSTDTAQLEEVKIPERDCSVWVGQLTGADFDRIRWADGKSRVSVDERGIMARAVVFAAREADGNRLFAAGEVDKVNETMPFAVLKRISEAVFRVNGMSEEDKADLLGN